MERCGLECMGTGKKRKQKKISGAEKNIRKENSMIFGIGEEKEVQKILTLSTCIGDGSSSQRLAVHAAVEMIFATKSGREEGSVLE